MGIDSTRTWRGNQLQGRLDGTSQSATNVLQIPARSRVGRLRSKGSLKLRDRAGDIARPRQKNPEIVSDIGIAGFERREFAIIFHRRCNPALGDGGPSEL